MAKKNESETIARTHKMPGKFPGDLVELDILRRGRKYIVVETRLSPGGGENYRTPDKDGGWETGSWKHVAAWHNARPWKSIKDIEERYSVDVLAVKNNPDTAAAKRRAMRG